MDNNETLAACYHPDFRQMIVIWPNTWCHEAGGGDWYIRYSFERLKSHLIGEGAVLFGPEEPIRG